MRSVIDIGIRSMSSHTGVRHRNLLAVPTASVLLLTAASNSVAEEDAPESSAARRPDTSSFHFASTFQGEDALQSGEWVLSDDSKYEGQESRVRMEQCTLEGGVCHGDYGLLLDEAHKHYGLGVTLPKPYDNKGKDLVMQYEVQVRDGPKCGGAYVKMLRGETGQNLRTLNNDTPYSIMFGPDKCFRDTDKVHFIFQHQNPITKKWEEKHFKDAPKIKDDKGFHVYTLHVKADNTFDLYIDTEVTASGNLLNDFKPSVNPPQEIDDPDDVQPEDWVTKAKIDDPSAVKPDDWDEAAPKEIPDESATMPEGWLEDVDDYIPDPTATKPDDWDDEEDGEWEPPMIANPECENSPGCGTWVRPLIRNPDYKGKWKAPKIDNPEYKGKWKPRKIENPDYFQDSRPSNMAPITGLAIEVWTVEGGIWFDNFVVGDDIGAALKLAEETWRPKFKAYEVIAAAEKKEKDKKRNKNKKDKNVNAPSKLLETSRLLADQARPYLPSNVEPALDAAAENPIALLVTLLLGLFVVFFFAPCRRRKPSRTPASAPTSSESSSPPAEQPAVKTDVVEKEVADTSLECDTATPKVQQENEQQKKSNGEVKESKVFEKKNGEVAKKDVEAEKKPGEVEKVDGEPKHEEGNKEVHGVAPAPASLAK